MYQPIIRCPLYDQKVGASFGDLRLSRRLDSLISQMHRHESSVIHRISDNIAEEVSYYRLLKNPRVDLPTMISHLSSPLSSAVKGGEVLVLGDSTEISLKQQYVHLSDAESVGVLSDNKTPGFHLHVGMVIDAQTGHGLGLSDMILWNRPKEDSGKSRSERSTALRKLAWENKETFKWHQCIGHSLERLSEADSVCFVFDAGADLAPLWHSLDQFEAEALIRLSHDRKVIPVEPGQGSEQKLRSYLGEQPVIGTYEFDLRELKRRNYSRNEAQKRQARRCQVALRVGQVRLKELSTQRSFYLIEAKETAQSLPEGEKPIHWVLLSTKPVEDFETAQKQIKTYAKRWMIEQLFRISKKQGFQMEETQLESLQGIMKQSLATMQAAFMVLTLLLARGQDQGQQSKERFNPQQLQCLKALNQKYQGKTVKQQNPHPPDQLSWAAWVIARLGGWKGATYRKPPGPITFFRGLQKFEMIFQGWIIANSEGDMLDP